MVRKTYLDSGILISLAQGPEKEPDQFRMATGILNKIRNGETIGVVSALALMEVVMVLRVKKGREKHILDKMTPDEQLKYVLRESKSMYDELIAELVRMPNLKFEQGGRRMGAGAAMMDALGILRNVTGKIRNAGGSRFSGAGPVDVIHALLAKDSGCDELVTFDTDFEEMCRFDALEDLEFRVLKW